MEYVWRIYLILLPLAGFIRLIERIMMEKGGFSSRYLPFLFLSLLAAGCYYSRKNQIFLRLWVWQTYYHLTLLVSVGCLFLSVYMVVIALWTPAGAFLLGFLFIFPAQLQIRRYAYFSEHIWGNNNQ